MTESLEFDHSGSALVFSGDVDGYEPALAALAADCDVLAHDFASPEREVEHGDLHAKPSEVGRTAAESKCGLLLLGHVMPELEVELDDAVALVRASDDGRLEIAHDLDRIAVTVRQRARR